MVMISFSFCYFAYLITVRLAWRWHGCGDLDRVEWLERHFSQDSSRHFWCIRLWIFFCWAGIHSFFFVGNQFERGKTDTFDVQCVDVGKLSKVRIGHDDGGVGAGWHLARVEVFIFLLLCAVFSFFVSKLVSKYRLCRWWTVRQMRQRTLCFNAIVGWMRAKTIMRCRASWRQMEQMASQPCRGFIIAFRYASLLSLFVVMLSALTFWYIYNNQVFTGDRSGAGTSARVSLELYGALGESGKRTLDPKVIQLLFVWALRFIELLCCSIWTQDGWARGSMREFDEEMVDLGALQVFSSSSLFQLKTQCNHSILNLENSNWSWQLWFEVIVQYNIVS